jgi:hypothetical protein
MAESTEGTFDRDSAPSIEVEDSRDFSVSSSLEEEPPSKLAVLFRLSLRRGEPLLLFSEVEKEVEVEVAALVIQERQMEVQSWERICSIACRTSPALAMAQ